MKERLDIRSIGVSLMIIIAVGGVLYSVTQIYSSLSIHRLQTLEIRASQAEQRQNYTEAFAVRTTIQELDPDNIANQLAIARLHYLVADLSLAQERIAEYLRVKPESIEGNLLQGHVALKLNNLTLAEKSFDTVLSLQTDHTEAQFYLALLYLANNNDKGVDLLQRAAMAPNTTSAISTFWTTWQEIVNDNNPLYRDTLLTYALLEVHQPYLALVVIEPIAQNEPNYVDAQYLLAVSYFQTNQQEQAKSAVELALTIDPTHQGSAQLLAIMNENMKI